MCGNNDVEIIIEKTLDATSMIRRSRRCKKVKGREYCWEDRKVRIYISKDFMPKGEKERLLIKIMKVRME